MKLKRGLLTLIGLAWMGLAFGAWIYVDQGLAEPALSFADVPGGSTGGFAGAMVATVAGWMLIGVVRQRLQSADWEQTGREAGSGRPARGACRS